MSCQAGCHVTHESHLPCNMWCAPTARAKQLRFLWCAHAPQDATQSLPTWCSANLDRHPLVSPKHCLTGRQDMLARDYHTTPTFLQGRRAWPSLTFCDFCKWTPVQEVCFSCASTCLLVSWLRCTLATMHS